MRVVFFGSPAVALPSLNNLIQAGHTVELVVTQPDKPAGRGKKLTPPPVKQFALARGIPVVQPEKIKGDEMTLAVIRRINPDLNVVVAYGQIIPPSIFNLPRFKSINVHFSLLPKYRGAAPVEWAILRGEEKTGVTIFELNERMDEGDILASSETVILPLETAVELEGRLAHLGAELLVQTLDRIDELPRFPQDHSQASYAPRLRKEDGQIDWRESALTIERKVRALGSSPGTYGFLHGRRVLIRKGKRIDGERPDQPPGRVVEITKEGIAVSCGQGTLFFIQRLQRENKKEMDASAFIQGTRIKVGDSFT